MSVSELYSSPPKPWCNINVNTINSASASSFGGTMNLNDNGIVNVSSINGNVLPPFNITLNPLNIIYRPSGPAPDPGSNIFTTWQAVINHASQININQIINIYFDDAVISPCPVDVSYDFQGRGNWYSYYGFNYRYVYVQINDGTLISNLSSLNATVNVECQSITGPNLFFTDDSVLRIYDEAGIGNTGDSVVPGLVVDNKYLEIDLYNFSYLYRSFVNLINVINSGNLTVILDGGSYMDNTVITDNTGALYAYYTDTAFAPVEMDVINFNSQFLSNSQSLYYDDSMTPNYGSSDVHGALNGIKQFLNSTLPCSNITASGTLSLTTSGSGLYLKRGSEPLSGTGVQLSLGQATVNTASVSVGDNVILTCTQGSVNIGFPIVTIIGGTSFTITSSNNLDDSIYSWVIIKFTT